MKVKNGDWKKTKCAVGKKFTCGKCTETFLIYITKMWCTMPNNNFENNFRKDTEAPIQALPAARDH